MTRSAILSLILSAFCLVFAALWLGQMIKTEDPYAAYRRLTIDHHKRLDRNARPGSVLLFGSSTLAGVDGSQLACPSVNFAIGAERLNQLVDRLSSYPSIDRAGLVVVQSGLVDVLMGDTEGLPAQLDQMLSRLTPRARVLMLGYQLVWINDRPDLTRQIAAVNAWAERACDRYDRCRWFRFEDLALKHPADFEADGVHLSQEAYRRFLQKLNRELSSSCQ